MEKNSIDIVIKNLSDGDIYTANEISLLTNKNTEYVKKVLANHSIVPTCGDGSGVIYYMDIKYDTIVDGIGFRNTVYCSGCNINCSECHNPQSWDIKNGKPVSVKELSNLLLENGNDITFSGGECSLQARCFIKLAKILKSNSRNIWLYSGHTYEELRQNLITGELIDSVDVLVDGKYLKELRNINLPFKGSSNQRIIDMKKTRETGKVTLYS